MNVIINFLICVFLWASPIFAESDTYRAAVVAYTPDLTAKKPSDRLYANVEAYLAFIKEAAAQRSDIIVFPEDGLTGWYDVITYPDIVELVSTEVPEPYLKVAPCTSSNIKYSKVFKDFSCSALKNQIYVVVNLVEQYYNEEINNYTYFNTDVVFDKNGCVVARYRKINLLNENLFLRGNETTSFRTDFGVKFGLYTCFDIVFKNPALDVLQDPEVTDVIFPVAWFSHLPLLQGLSVHHGYVVSNGVNLLAAGLHDPKSRNGGTAIYLANGDILKVYINGQQHSKLLIGDVPKISKRNSIKNCQILNQNSEPTPEELLDVTSFVTSSEDLSNYTFKSIDLQKKMVQETICSGDHFCCKFDIHLEGTTQANYAYKLIAYYGTVELSATDRLGTRTCAIVACKTEDKHSCGRRHKEPPKGVTFKSISVKGVFKYNNAHDQPSTLRYDLKPVTNYTFCRSVNGDDEVEVSLNTSENQNLLLTFGLYGRVFGDDGKPVGVN